MKLRDYLAAHNIKPTAFAATVGCPPSTITRIVNGEREPGLPLIRKIREATGGDVTADDWLDPAVRVGTDPAIATAEAG